MNELIGRLHLEEAIGKAQQRNARRAAREWAARAAQARDDAAMYIAENPFTAVAGSLVIGMLIGSMVPRLRLGRALAAIATPIADAGMAYGRQALAKARKATRHEAATEHEKDD